MDELAYYRVEVSTTSRYRLLITTAVGALMVMGVLLWPGHYSPLYSAIFAVAVLLICFRAYLESKYVPFSVWHINDDGEAKWQENNVDKSYQLCLWSVQLPFLFHIRLTSRTSKQRISFTLFKDQLSAEDVRRLSRIIGRLNHQG